VNKVQVFDIALFKGIMDISEFAIPCLEGPLFMGIQIPKPDVVDDNILDQRIAMWLLKYRSMQICILISCTFFYVFCYIFMSGMKYF
jgi:hypothetical protein